MSEQYKPKTDFIPGDTRAFGIEELFISLAGNKFYNELYSNFTGGLTTVDAGCTFNSFLEQYTNNLALLEQRLEDVNLSVTDRGEIIKDKKDLEQAIAWLQGVLEMFSHPSWK